MLESQISGLRTPQNLISPLPSPAPQIISTEINTATRGVHARLNKLIIARLPFALPPYSDSPGLYAIGIDRFSQIYFAFEETWNQLVEKQKAGELDGSAHEIQMREWLADLVPPGLWRTKSIRSDLDHLSKVLGIKLDGAHTTGSRKSVLAEHIQRVVKERPHVLVAYAWIMYMAIFSGGRWIRQQLLDAGPSFWHVSEPDVEKSSFRSHRNPVPGFSLFYFEGERDGEDIKTDFKARLDLAEELLSQKERKEIAEEACFIFDACIGLVEELDAELGTSGVPDTPDTNPPPKGSKAEPNLRPAVQRVKTSNSGPLTALLAVLLACLAAWLLGYGLMGSGRRATRARFEAI